MKILQVYEESVHSNAGLFWEENPAVQSDVEAQLPALLNRARQGSLKCSFILFHHSSGILK